MEEKNSRIALDFIKKNWIWVVLILILIFGFYLRVYHVDYPVIGYHNWKETHYLTEARNFARDGFFEYGFFVPAVDYPILQEDGSGAHSDTFPTVSIIVALLFKIFGFELTVARLVGIIFNSATIIMTFLLVKKLFNNKYLSLTAAFLTAINPLLVFFSHNVQLINPALFFMVTSCYFYLRYLESEKNKELMITLMFLVLSIMTKYTFFIIIIPILFTFPYKKFFKKVNFKKILISTIIILPFPLWFIYSNYILPKKLNLTVSIVNKRIIDISPIFTSNFWRIMKAYAADNFTLLGILFVFIGLILFFILYKKKNIRYKFILFYIIGTIPWFLISAYKLGGHSYHQYPIAPLFIILISFAIISIANSLGKIIEKLIKINLNSIPKILIIIILVVLIIFPSIEAKNRQFNTQFIGLDIAGDYINNHALPSDKLIHSGHQDFGVIWHADRKGIDGGIPTLENIKFAEDKQNVKWIFIYRWGMEVFNDQERWQYIKNNYGLKQIAFLKSAQGLQPIYFLLKKGGTFDESKLNEVIKNKTFYQRDYEFTDRKTKLVYVNIEE